MRLNKYNRYILSWLLTLLWITPSAQNKEERMDIEATHKNEQGTSANERLVPDQEASALIKMSALYSTSENNHKMGYLYVDTKESVLTALKVSTYSSITDPTLIEETDLMPYVKGTDFSSAQVVEFPITLNESNLYRFTYTLQDQNAVQSPYHDGTEEFDYTSDLPYTYTTGFGTLGVDRSVDGGTLNITGKTYKKGFGVHAVGWLKHTLLPGKYSHFITDIGKQNGRINKMEFTLKMDGELIVRTGSVNNTRLIHWDYPTTNKGEILIEFLNGDDNNNAHDHGAVGAPRLYLTPLKRKAQSISWREEQIETHNKPFKIQLDAMASSGLSPIYRIVKGAEFATIEEGNTLNIHNFPGKDSILVEAFQPGNLEWEPTETQKCVFRLTKGRIVQKNERIELENGENLDELTIYADANSCGQVTVKEGIAAVKKLILKYTFAPETWNFLSFPTNLNLDKISNLNALGYHLNGQQTGQGGYYIRKYDTEKRADTAEADSWTPLNTPEVEGMKGYIMSINNALGEEPCEVVFTIDNVLLNFETPVYPLNLTLNLTHVIPDTSQSVYIAPTNVKGERLKVDVKFTPQDYSILPVNFTRALKEARITYTPNGNGMRITLPDSTPAKVVIYDRQMQTPVKAIRYVSPMMIDISDIEPGTYQMIISYGNAIDTKTFEKQ